MAPEKVFLARKLLEFTTAERIVAGSHLATGAPRRELSWVQAQGQRLGGGPWGAPLEIFCY